MDELINVAQLGIEAERFKSSALGNYLQDRAESEVSDAITALTEVDPTDVKKITELQNKIYRANSFTNWIFDAVDNGNFAIDEMRDNND